VEDFPVYAIGFPAQTPLPPSWRRVSSLPLCPALEGDAAAQTALLLVHGPQEVGRLHALLHLPPPTPGLVLAPMARGQDLATIRSQALCLASLPQAADLSALAAFAAAHLELVQEVAFRKRFHRVARRRMDLFIGSSDTVRRVLDQALLYARQKETVLVTGKSGTGKDLLARTIHRIGPRHDGPFVVADCTSLPRDLMESELFGHRRGAFTGAVGDREGLVAAAQGGVLFLDEIGEVPLDVQSKLLRFLQSGGYRPVGETMERQADVQVIAATNRLLEEEVMAHRFRDLFYRLNVLRIHLPDLRERLEDIPELCDHARRLFNEESGRQVAGFGPEALALLKEQPWPGNVRELFNVARRAMIMAPDHDVIGRDAVAAALGRTAPPGADAGFTPLVPGGEGSYRQQKARMVRAFDRAWVARTLDAAQGNVSRAARDSGMDRKTFYTVMKRGSGEDHD